VMLLLATFLAAISNNLSMTFEGIYVRSLGGGNFLIGVMIAIAAFTELPAMFYSERIARRLGGTTTILLAYGFTASAYLGYILVSNPSLLPIFSILKGLGYGLNLTNVVVMLTERTPDEWASTAQSFLSIGWMGIAPLVAAPLGGLIHDAISPAAVFGLGVVTIIIAAMVLWLASFLGKLD
jgi:MFS family permease